MSYQNDRHGRNTMLASYIQYQAHLPHPDFRNTSPETKERTDRPGISLLSDDEVGNFIMRNNGETSGELKFYLVGRIDLRLLTSKIV